MPQLGSTQLSTAQLGDTVPFFGMKTTDETVSTSELQPVSKSEMSMGTTDPTVGPTGPFVPVILDPQNINVEYNQSRGLWESSWMPTDTFDDERDQLVAVLSLQEGADPVDVVIERDTDGDNSPDLHSNVLTIDANQEIAYAEPEGQRGFYRLIFPQYNQTDVVDRLNVAITYDNTERLIENIPYQFLQNDIRSENIDSASSDDDASRTSSAKTSDGSDDISPLIEALGTTLDRIDATIDAVYDNRFVESARGDSLNKLGRPVGVQRRDIGNPERSDDLEGDQRLRKRVAAAKALVGLDTTSPSFSQLLKLLFPQAVTAIDINAVADKPEAEVVIPTNTVNRNPLNVSEIQTILSDAVASSYNIQVNTSGTYEYTSQTEDEDWNDGAWMPQ